MKRDDRLDVWGSLLTLILALPATLPLLQAGYFDSDDGWIHLYRLAALDRALHAGVLFPRWFPHFAFGYGYPVLNFYSPLGYYLAEVWHLVGADYIVATKLTIATGFLLAGWAMYRFAAEVMGPTAGVIAAIAYTYAPYHLADAYLRGALAEHLAFIWFPLILWAIWRHVHGTALHSSNQRADRRQRTTGDGRQRAIVWMALCGTGLILTHNLSALFFAPVAAAYALLLILKYRDRAVSLLPVLFSFLAALLLALALSAFYWLPALTESRYVHLALDFGSTGYRQHLVPFTGLLSPFVLHRYYPDQGTIADHPLGLVQGVLALAGVAGLLIEIQRTRRKSLPSKLHFLFFLIVSVAALLMTSTISLPVWHIAERAVSVLQYPWRFMALVALGTAMLSGGITDLWPPNVGKRPETMLLLPVAVVAAMGVAGFARLEYDAEPLNAGQVTVQRMWDEDYQHKQIGATWTAEYLPRWVRQARWAIPRPAPALPAKEQMPSGIFAIRLEKSSSLEYTAMVTTTIDRPLSLHQFYFPGWEAEVDGKPAEVYSRGELGLATVTVPAGTHRVSLRFGGTPARRWGTLASLLTVVGLLGVGLWQGNRQQRARLLVAVAIAGGLAVYHLFSWASPPPTTAVEGAFGAEAQLAGYRADRSVYHPGDTVRVTLYWMGISSQRTNYKVFVHLTAKDSPVPLTQHDGDPVGGYTPTTRWLPGELVADTHTLLLPVAIAPGPYLLWAGMYDYANGTRLPISATTKNEERRLFLGEIRVEK